MPDVTAQCLTLDGQCNEQADAECISNLEDLPDADARAAGFDVDKSLYGHVGDQCRV
ncbi:hypothetical protein [Noviherbaspirillum sp. L7-7A]|uniref:hypothetical protein n=1 Tax=Noviherbaspirillum sp. L7-7A TaxID=2850560 RepID=UPI002011382C|nr:hypothetical protein [Noviherbaspirillum sp. L7-7A]